MSQILLLVAWLLLIFYFITIVIVKGNVSNVLHDLQGVMIIASGICFIMSLCYTYKDLKATENTEEAAIKDVANGYELYLDGNCIQKTESITIDKEKYEISIDNNEKCVYLERK